MSGIYVKDLQTGASMTVLGEEVESFYRNGKCGSVCRVNGETVYYVALTSSGMLNAVPFASLDEVDAAIAAYWSDGTMPGFTPAPTPAERVYAATSDDPASLSPRQYRAAVAALPEYDETTCWECGTTIADGDGVLDEPQGWAHRSCVGA